MSILSRRTLLAAAPAWAWGADAAGALQAVEARAGGRLGVCLLDTNTGRVAGHRLDERFAMCSTFKLPLAALVLQEVAQGRWKADERMAFSRQDLLPNSPVTGEHVARGWMTPLELAEATQMTSDNAAANLLLAKMGGPAGFTARVRRMGARKTRLDHLETRMNLVLPGEETDTTTPRDMAVLLRRMVLRELPPAERERLIGWMVATKTGTKRIRAGLPAGWRAGDKTGTAMMDAMTDKYNDVALVWPAAGKGPMVVTAYFDSSRRSADVRDEDQAVLAEVGRIAAAWVMG